MKSPENSKQKVESNFSFMKDIELYEKSDIYKRICENARFAEGAYYINSDICNFYIRKTLELVCKFLEVSNNLSIYTKYNSGKKTIGTYLMYENYLEFMPAIGGPANYELLKQLNTGINPSAHEDYTASENELGLYDTIIGLFQLMVWFYRDLGGKRNILKGDFDESRIPEEFDISYFFKYNDVNIDVSERDKRYLQSLQRQKEKETKSELAVSESIYRKTEQKCESTIEQYEEKIKKVQKEITELRDNYAQDEKKWFEEKEKIVGELKKSETVLSEMQEDSREKQQVITQLRMQLDIEAENHKKDLEQYVGYFSQMNGDIIALKAECEKYRQEKEYLETVVVEYENLKAKYQAVKYHMTTETQYLHASSKVNQLVTNDSFTGMEQLKIYLLRLKAYYDEKEEKYQEEINRIKEERDTFQQKYENEKRKREVLYEESQTTIEIEKTESGEKIENSRESNRENSRLKKGYSGGRSRRKKRYLGLIALNFLLAFLVLMGIFHSVEQKANADKGISGTGETEKMEEANAGNVNQSSDGNIFQIQTPDITQNEQEEQSRESMTDGETEQSRETIPVEDTEQKPEETLGAASDEGTSQKLEASPDDSRLQDIMNAKLPIPEDFTCVPGINETLLDEIFYINSLHANLFENFPNQFEIYDRIDIWCVDNTDDFFRWTDPRMIVYKPSNIIKFMARMNQNEMYAVTIEDFVDGLDASSTLEDCKQVFGDNIYFYENAHPTSFSTSEEEDMTMFRLQDGSKILLGWNKEGKICDYVYFYPLVTKYNNQ